MIFIIKSMKNIFESHFTRQIKNIKKRYYKLNLTLVNRSKERSTIFPLVIVNLFCDLTMRNNTVRLSLAGKSYQRESYAAFPIILLWKRKNMKYVRDIRKLINCHFSLSMLTLALRYSPEKQYINASRLIEM